MTTQTTTEQLIAESEAVMTAAGKMDIEEMMRNATDQAEPGDKAGSVVHKPNSDTPFGMTISDIQSAGWVRVWDVRTHEMSLVNRNLLRSQLSKRDASGKAIFTTVEPKELPVRGSRRCPLHADSPDRAEMDMFGFVTCPKANLRTPLDVRTHMQHRHRREFEALEEERKNRREEEERQVRRVIIDRNTPAPRADVSGSEPTTISGGEAILDTASTVDAPAKRTRKRRARRNSVTPSA